MTPALLRRNAVEADHQGAHGLAERLRAKAARLEAQAQPAVSTMTTSDLRVLAEKVTAELARRGGGRDPAAKPHHGAGIQAERGGREK